MADTKFDKNLLKIRSMEREVHKKEHQNDPNLSKYGINVGDSVDEEKKMQYHLLLT